MTNSILLLGAIYVDVVLQVPVLPTSGADIAGKITTYNVGGSALNVFHAVRYCQQQATLLAPIGQGPYAAMIRKHFAAHKIPITLSAPTADNGWDLALVEPSGERSFLSIGGIDQHWQADWFALPKLDQYRYCYLSGYQLADSTSAKVILNALAHQLAHTTLLFDASPRFASLPVAVRRQLLVPNVMIHCNESESKQLQPGIASITQRAQAIYQQTHSPVIITLGAKGTFYLDGAGSGIVPAQATHVVNTIGAGDTHCGGLLAALSAGKSLPQAITIANQLATQVVCQTSSHL
jgi:sugar/nucleoside kinase (ribokinase family)